MKNLIKYILILFLFNSKLYAQSDTLKIKDSIVLVSDLSNEQWHIWDSINSYWLKNVFNKCLKQNNIKLNCAHCSSVYITVNLYIDNEGKLVKYEVLKERICGLKASEKLKKCFFDYFQQIVFPAPLRNINIQAQLGNGLKC